MHRRRGFGSRPFSSSSSESYRGDRKYFPADAASESVNSWTKGRMAKILITGIMGTLGRPLKLELERRGHDVWGVDLQHEAETKYFRADISSFRQLERALEQDYDYVYHLAAEFGRINGEEYYDTLWQTNVIGTRNILEIQKKKGFKLVFASSSESSNEVPVNCRYWKLASLVAS